MCSYLFAAFSIKRDVKEGVTEEQLFIGPPKSQIADAYFSLPGLLPVTDLESAVAAIQGDSREGNLHLLLLNPSRRRSARHVRIPRGACGAAERPLGAVGHSENGEPVPPRVLRRGRIRSSVLDRLMASRLTPA